MFFIVFKIFIKDVVGKTNLNFLVRITGNSAYTHTVTTT